MATLLRTASNVASQLSHSDVVRVRRHTFEQNLPQPRSSSLEVGVKPVPQFSHGRGGTRGQAQATEQCLRSPRAASLALTANDVAHRSQMQSTRLPIATGARARAVRRELAVRPTPRVEREAARLALLVWVPPA